MSRVIPLNPEKEVTGDLGWEECRSCAHANSGTCDFCEEADQYEEADLESLLRKRELLAAQPNTMKEPSMRSIARHQGGQTTIWGPHTTDDYVEARSMTCEAIAADESLTRATLILVCIPGGKK